MRYARRRDILPELPEARRPGSARSGTAGPKQYYYFDLDLWLKEHATMHGAPPRNIHWRHMVNDDIISMPDKWEYPWYAACSTSRGG
jgi:hypothetical protein